MCNYYICALISTGDKWSPTDFLLDFDFIRKVITLNRNNFYLKNITAYFLNIFYAFLQNSLQSSAEFSADFYLAIQTDFVSEPIFSIKSFFLK